MFRPQTTIRREGWYYLLILAVVLGGAVFKEVNLLLILAGMLLGGLLLNWGSVRAQPAEPEADRKLPPGLSAGDRLSVKLSLTNTRPGLADGRSWSRSKCSGSLSPGGGNNSSDAAAASQRAVSLRASRPIAKGAYRGRLAERGRYQFGPLRLSTRFPFGLFSRTVAVGETETLVVLPRLGRLTEGWAARRRRGTGRQRPPSRRPGPEGDFYGVREWRAATGGGWSMAQLGPAWQAGGPCSSSGRGAATWPWCSTSGSRNAPPPNTPRTWNWPSVSPPRCWPTCAARREQRLSWRSSDPGPECGGGPASPVLLAGPDGTVGHGRSPIGRRLLRPCWPTPCVQSPPARKSSWSAPVRSI